MSDPAGEDPRFIEGVRLFNKRDFFEAHEVWEDLWHEMTGPERRFVQGLIQAAVCAYHSSNGNVIGARRLFVSARRHMTLLGPFQRGLDVGRFWVEMETALGELLQDPPPDDARFDADRLPIIVIRPSPGADSETQDSPRKD